MITSLVNESLNIHLSRRWVYFSLRQMLERFKILTSFSGMLFVGRLLHVPLIEQSSWYHVAPRKEGMYFAIIDAQLSFVPCTWQKGPLKWRERDACTLSRHAHSTSKQDKHQENIKNWYCRYITQHHIIKYHTAGSYATAIQGKKKSWHTMTVLIGVCLH